MSDFSVYDNLQNFEWHETAAKFLYSESRTRAVIKGNQGGGTAVSMADLAMRVLEIHPVEWRNVLNKPVRLVSKCLPQNEGDEENQQYVEFRKFIPPDLIMNKITARSSILEIRSVSGAGKNKKVEFMSSKQDLDAFMSVQRQALYQDEEIDKMKWDENQIRLLKENGDSTITLTPVRGLDWSFDHIWRRASRICRSETICAKFGLQKEEIKDTGADIEVFCWATDDNPAMTIDTINRIMEGIDDEDELAMRRYSVFRQVSGRIFKTFDTKVHRVPRDQVWDPSLFRTYWHFRIIDYHQRKPWNVSWVAVSPTHEWFVWNELLANHDHMVCHDLRDKIKAESLLDEDEEFNRATLIDPLANTKQTNTGLSVFEDLSMGELGLRRLTTADTKNEQGEMNIRMRLKNSLICGVPGNNINKQDAPDMRYGHYRPTIWFLDNCKGHIDHFVNWRYVDPVQERIKAIKIVKQRSERWSDYCRNLEFLGALNPVVYQRKESHFEPSRLFQGRRHAA